MNAAPCDRLGTVVLGMHRSGTSAASRLLNLLGLSLGPEAELLPADDGNPTGYWESAPLVEANEELLLALGGHWSAPPCLEEGWADRQELDELRTSAVELLHSTLTADWWVWKDPRLCLTLPFWTRVVEGRLAVVLVHRNPVDVAASLSTRDGSSTALGLALWERYVRNALAGASGRPVFVTSYEHLLADPGAWCGQVADFLRSQGVRIGAIPLDEVAAFVRLDPRHVASDGVATRRHRVVSDELSSLHAALDDVAGAHASFEPPELPMETGWVEPLLSERRRAIAFERQAHESRAALAQLDMRLAAVQSSRSYRALAPLRALAERFAS